MKNILLILSFICFAATGYGQGTIIFHNTSSTYAIMTNATAIGGGVGPLTTTPNSFYFALLIAPYDGIAPTRNPLDGLWTFTGVLATNHSLVHGGIAGPGGPSGTAILGWGAPTDSSYTSSERNYFMIVGWSASVGTTWDDVLAALQGQTEAFGLAFFGFSEVGNGYAGGGPPPGLVTPSLFGVTVGMPGGLTQGFDLIPIVPEPSAFALFVLGGIALFRRLKAEG